MRSFRLVILVAVAAVISSGCSSSHAVKPVASEAPTTEAPVTEPAAALTRPAAGKHWVMGFYPEYQRELMPIDEIEWDTMTHLAVGRVVPKSSGELDMSFDNDDTAGPAFARDLAAAARAHGVTPILMVGGDGAHDGFATAAASHRAQLVSSLLGAMHRLGFAGLDLDFEPIEDADQPALASLIADLRRAEPGIALSLGVGWVSTTFPDVAPFYAKVAPLLDQINVMTYGMAGAWDGWKSWHGSALDGAADGTPSSVAANVKAYLTAGVPAAKLGLGVGFYGECWSGGVNGPHQDIGTSKLVADDNDMSYVNIMKDYFDKADYRYDAAARAPYLSFTSPKGPKKCTFVSYENDDSIRAKGAYALRNGLGGAIVWTVNQAHDRTAPAGRRDALLRVTRSAFGA